MRTFRLELPTSLDGALAILAADPERSRPIAGGTALMNLWKQHLLDPEVLVDLSRIPELHGISRSDGRIGIGASVTLAELEDSPLVQDELPLLHTAVRSTANRRIRELATLGGSLCFGESASDVSAGTLASGAELHLAGPGGRRSLPAEAFYRGAYETVLGPGEIVTRVELPCFGPRHRYAYLKFSPRSHYDKPALGVAVSWQQEDDGRCSGVRVAFSNAGATPLRCPAAEQALEGRLPTGAAVELAAEAAARTLDPLDDLKASRAYKLEMARVFLRRAVARAKGQGVGE